MTVNEVIGSLSPREREIAEAYVAGASHKEIARQFDISPATVRTHLRAIYRKLEVASKLELAGALRDEPAPPAGPGRDAQLLVADLALELDEAMRRERILARVLRIISQEGDRLDAVIDAVLDHALEICEAEFGVLFEYCGDLRFRAMQWRNISPSFGRWLSDQDVFEVDAETGLGRVARGLESVNIADVRSEDIYRERAPLRMATGDPDGARSFAAIPMMSGGHLIGAFTVYRTRVHPFNERSLELARLFADQAAIAIKNARRPDKAAAAETEAQADPPLLAILPFRATDETDDDLGRTGRRLAAGIVMELSSTPHFRLIDLASSFSERLAASPPAQAMKTLGAGLIVTGQIRRAAAGRVRIAAWLHQAGHFPPLWTERFDLPGEDIETFLETLLVRLCAAIGTTVERALVIRSRRSPGPNALDHFLDGLAFHHRHTADAYREARSSVVRQRRLPSLMSGSGSGRAGVRTFSTPRNATHGPPSAWRLTMPGRRPSGAWLRSTEVATPRPSRASPVRWNWPLTTPTSSRAPASLSFTAAIRSLRSICCAAQSLSIHFMQTANPACSGTHSFSPVGTTRRSRVLRLSTPLWSGSWPGSRRVSSRVETRAVPPSRPRPCASVCVATEVMNSTPGPTAAQLIVTSCARVF